MTGIASQALAAGQPAPGFPQRDVSPGNLGVENGRLKPATFTAARNFSYIFPTGGTVTLPSPTGSGAFIVLSAFGTGISTLSGIISAGGTIFSTFQVSGDQTLIICDADPTRGWV